MLNIIFAPFCAWRRKRVAGGTPPPKKNRKNILGHYYVKFGHFVAKHVKVWNFVNFSGKYTKNSGILITFSARSM